MAGRVREEDAYRLPVFVPSLDEQRRVAAILDNADVLRRKRKRALDLIENLNQSMFVAMFGNSKESAIHTSTSLQEFVDIQVRFAFKSADYTEDLVSSLQSRAFSGQL